METGEIPQNAHELVIKNGFLVHDDDVCTIHDWTQGDLTLSTVQLKRGQQTKMHSHKHSEVYVILRGYGRITVGNKHYLFFKDDVFFIAPGEEHQVKDLGNGIEFLCVFKK